MTGFDKLNYHKNNIEPIFVASEQGLDASIQTAATKVTNIGSILSLGVSVLSSISFTLKQLYSPLRNL